MVEFNAVFHVPICCNSLEIGRGYKASLAVDHRSIIHFISFATNNLTYILDDSTNYTQLSKFTNT